MVESRPGGSGSSVLSRSGDNFVLLLDQRASSKEVSCKMDALVSVLGMVRFWPFPFSLDQGT